MIKVSAKDVLWADLIFAMEKSHKQCLIEKFPTQMLDKKVIVLDIADDYNYMDAELIDTIKISVSPYLQNVKN